MLVTALSPIIGYDNAASIAKKALKNISGDSSQYADTSIAYQTL